MKLRLSGVALLLLGTVLAGGWLANSPRSFADISRRSSITTFSTANIGRQGHFYVGGHYVGEPGKETMDGAMYVEVWVPKDIRHPYPIVFVTGGGGQGAYTLMQTPEGRPAWSSEFVNQGYTAYMM